MKENWLHPRLATSSASSDPCKDYHQQYLAKPGARPYCSAQPQVVDLPAFESWCPQHLQAADFTQLVLMHVIILTSLGCGVNCQPPHRASSSFWWFCILVIALSSVPAGEVQAQAGRGPPVYAREVGTQEDSSVHIRFVFGCAACRSLSLRCWPYKMREHPTHARA